MVSTISRFRFKTRAGALFLIFGHAGSNNGWRKKSEMVDGGLWGVRGPTVSFWSRLGCWMRQAHEVAQADPKRRGQKKIKKMKGAS